MPTSDTPRREIARPASPRKTWLVELVIFSLALAALVCVYHVRVNQGQPSLDGLGGGDPHHYDRMARSFLAGRWFSNIMFGLRPPAFPLFIALVYALVGVKPYIVVFFQLVLGALTITLSYKICIRLLRNRTIAIIAAVLAALETAHLDATVTMMSEPLHNFLLFVSLYWLVVFLQTERRSALVAGALAMGVAMLARPIVVYFVVIIGLVIVLHRPRLWRQAVALVALCAVPYVGWSYRNLRHAGNFSFSTDAVFTLLFYKAVSVESHATGRDPTDVAIDIVMELEHRLGNDEITREEVAAFPVGRPEDLFANDPQRTAISREMAMERFRAYPGWALIMTGVSLVRQFDTTHAMAIPIWLQRAMIIVELLLAMVGYWTAWKNRHRLFLLLSHAVIGYYAGSTALALAGLYHVRFRTPYMPFLLMYTALGASFLAQRVLGRNAKRPVDEELGPRTQ